MTRYAFYLDASACSGCKACQVACQDKHQLPLGVLWRRVYEVSGGSWRLDDVAWRQDAFAYNLSIACNHCAQPVCVEVCPTGAMHRREDGIVLIDAGRCVGCRYCEWACPYGAPQYDAAAGHMTKCTLCADELPLGKEPACVAACGLRALDFGTPEDLAMTYGVERTESGGRLVRAGSLAAASPPLPDPALTEPALLLRSHPHAVRAANGAGRVANLEEVRHAALHAPGELSLVAFTLLVQLAVGLYWAWLAVRWANLPPAESTDLLLLSVGPVLASGLGASLLHLGTPRHAWRALANLRTSWLSREILLTGKFGLGWLVALGIWLLRPARGSWAELAFAAVALVGVALIHAMARVYHLRTVPAWNPPRTFRSFLLTALVTGAAGAALLLALGGGSAGKVVALAALFAAVVTAAAIFRRRFYDRRLGSGL